MNLRDEIEEAVRLVRENRIPGPYMVLAQAGAFRDMGVRVPKRYADSDVLAATYRRGRVSFKKGT